MTGGGGRPLWPPHRLDLAAGDLARAAAALADRTPPGDVGGRWHPHGIAAASVRSAFDLLLSAAGWRAGDEVVFSAVTHADMPAIARAHGLRVRAADVEAGTLAPAPAAVAAAVGPRTRAVVVAHLLGARSPLAPLRDACERAGALLVEDGAQGWRGPGDHGDDAAHVSLFSFGLIKTATALGGALARVDDAHLRARMAALQAARRRASDAAFARRLALAAALCGAAHPHAFRALDGALRAAGADPDVVLPRLVRGVRPTAPAARLAAFRVRPAPAALRFLAARVEAYDAGRLRRRRATGERLVAAAGPLAAGRDAATRSHWLAAVAVADPAAAAARLRAAGFAVSARTSTLAAVVDDATGVPPRAAADLLRRLVFLPTYPELPDAEVDRLASLVRELAAAEGAYTAGPDTRGAN